MKIESLTIFPNGNSLCFDEEGEQMDIQAKGWLYVYLEYLESNGFDPRAIKDIHMIVNGRQVYAQPFKDEDGEWSVRFVDY